MYTIGIKDLLEGQVLAHSVKARNGSILYKSGSLLTQYSVYNIQQNCNPNESVAILTFSELRPRLSSDSILASNFVNFIATQFGECFNASFNGVTNLLSLSEKLTSYLIKNRGVLQDLVLVKYAHEYTYNHCINVALVSLQIGIGLGMSEDELQSLALGSLLHDLGKIVIPKLILDKPAGLSPIEFDLIKGHPEAGCKIIDNYYDIDRKAYSIINEHHEKLDGSGYPNHKDSKSIQDLSKIVAVADIFDAITSARPYHRAASTFKCLNILDEDSSRGKVDASVVDALRSRVVLYPQNSFVKLSNGKTGYVVESDSTGLRPVVMDLVNKQTYDLREERSLDVLYAV